MFYFFDYNMHGNVWEWCQDWFLEKLSGGIDPSGATKGPYRLFRGGAWRTGGQNCRSAKRERTSISYRNDYQGLRIALLPLGKTLPAITPAISSNHPIKIGQKPGEEWSGNGLQMKFCWCPSGKFVMGSPETELGRDGNQEKQVVVVIAQPFWMGKNEVTQAEYTKVMGNNPSSFQVVDGENTGRFPVEKVSWTEAAEFCRKWTEAERVAGRLPQGWEYRLPKEAEWEYACRAGTTTATAFGNSMSSLQANFDGERPYNGAELGPSIGRTTAVESYPPNDWGLHDMHGNVKEWCLDSYDEVPSDWIGPKIASANSYRVYRGGHWGGSGDNCRAADRIMNTPSSRYEFLGFRVALVPSGK